MSALTPDEVAARLKCSVRQACRVMRAAGGFYIGTLKAHHLRAYEEPIERLMSRALSLEVIALEDARVREEVVYFIRGGDRVKIGWTANVHQRLSTMAIGSPVDLTVDVLVIGGADLEAVLHVRYSRYRSHGEWFRREGELAELIDSLRAAQ